MLSVLFSKLGAGPCGWWRFLYDKQGVWW